MAGLSGEERPWGNYRILHREPGMQVKRLEVKPGMRFSLQKHNHRSERWIVVAGAGTATLGKKDIAVSKGSFIEVPCGEPHRMANTGTDFLVLIEVQFGDYLGEDDIVRLEDDFGRS
jgi:mannose-6-phosphate isomerase-like protein (cupin superfamily)